MRKLVVLSSLALSACAAREAPPATPLEMNPRPIIPETTPTPEMMTFRAIGTEPFWSITTSEREVIYSTPELSDGVRLYARSEYYQDGSSGTEIISFRGTLNGEVLVLEIASGACSDGMSDTVYPYTAKLRIGERTEQGCAKKL